MEIAPEISCAVCLEIYTAPVTLQCGHSFCRMCLTSCYTCPLCRGSTQRRHAGSVDSILEEHIEGFKIKCRVCQASVPARSADLHPCGPSAFPNLLLLRSDISPASTRCCQTDITTGDDSDDQTTGGTTTRRHDGSRPEASIQIDEDEDYENNEVNQSSQVSLSCPFCSQNGFDELSLVNHCIRQHADCDGQTKICPICVRYHWGDPTYVSTNLLRHLQYRHSFLYSDIINVDQDEERHLSDAIAVSARGHQVGRLLTS
eukprot:GHVS01052805.1.p1 GENE.GHVS01052805.1~~GHVS01052805.1.p1  ORF type:complete len:259 (+),score=19.30 GHVS01052805.1:263-1039(+)